MGAGGPAHRASIRACGPAPGPTAPRGDRAGRRGAVRYRYRAGLAKRLGLEDGSSVQRRSRPRRHAGAGRPTVSSSAPRRKVSNLTSAPLAAYADDDGTGAPRGFPTPTRRIEIYSEPLLRHGYLPVPASSTRVTCQAGDAGFPLRLGRPRPLPTATASTAISPRCVGSLQTRAWRWRPAAAAARGIAEGDWVRVRRLRAQPWRVPGWCQASPRSRVRAARLVGRWSQGSPYGAGQPWRPTSTG